MAGALSDNDAQDMNQMQMGQMVAQQRGQPQGALSSAPDDAPDDGSGFDSQSPQETRDLQSLAFAKGMMAPMHTGAPLLEGYGNVASNEYNATMEHVKQNGLLRAKLAAINAQDLSRQQINQANIEGKTAIAKIMAGKTAEQLMSDDEVADAGFPPGTVAAVNNFGKVRVLHKPPVSQQMLTGFDDSGKPQYADPGAALTPQVRTSAQNYLRQSAQLAPQLDDLISKVGSSQTALGVSGAAERGLNATVGQVKNLVGISGAIAPKDTKLQNQMELFNESALPVLEADPRHQAMGAKARDELIQGMLPDPDSWHTDAGTAVQKLKDLKAQIGQRRALYSSMLGGKGLTNPPDGQDDGISISGNASSGDLPPPSNPSQINENMIRQHAQDAIARGANPDIVAKRAKAQYGIDIGGQ